MKKQTKLEMWAECGDDFYYGREGDPVDFELAFGFYEKAAKKKHPYSTYRVGYCYEHGKGVAPNTAMANMYYAKAAELGYVAENTTSEKEPASEVQPATANNSLFAQAMALYDRNEYAAAFDLFRQAAETQPEAQYVLGVMYANGEGVQVNMAETVYWYEKAATAGHADAQYNLAILYYDGHGVKKDLTTALQWYEAAAEQGDSLAQHDAAIMYYNGYGTPKDFARAFHWFTQSAARGDADAQFSLAKLYENGEGTEKSNKQAILFMTRAAEQGHVAAQSELGRYYSAEGLGGHDADRSLFLYDKAALNGDADAIEKIRDYCINYENGSRVISTLRCVSQYAEMTPDMIKTAIGERIFADRQGFSPLALTFLLVKAVRGADALYDEDVVRAYVADFLPMLPELRTLSALLYSTGAIDLLMNGKREPDGAAKKLTDAGAGVYEAETLVRCFTDVLDWPDRLVRENDNGKQ